MYWLGIDVGTGGTRALLIDRGGRVTASATAAHEPIRMDHPSWAEQRPADWWDATCEAVRTVMAESAIDKAAVSGVGLSGQMHGLVMLDEDGAVIRDALIWCDQRSQPQVDAIERKVGRDQVLERIANPMLTGFTLPKMLWVRDHDPQSYQQFRTLLLPKDYIRFELTGQAATDVSDASGTGLFDVAHRQWAEDLARALDVDTRVLPHVVESDAVAGHVSQAGATMTGLAVGTPVVGGGGDQAASAVGNGIVEPGIVSCTIGTSGVVFAQLSTPAYDPRGRVHTFCHAAARAWHVMGVTQGAGLSLDWYRKTLAPETSFDDLIAEAATARAGSDGLYWLPYLMGERTPHLDSGARGGWIGLTARHGRAEMIRSLMEGVTYSQKDALDVIESMGVPVSRVRLSGGGARSPFWCQMFADVFNRPVAVLETEEGSAYGAALLALAGTGRSGSIEEISKRASREARVYTPQSEASACYARGHATYRTLYPALKRFYETS